MSSASILEPYLMISLQFIRTLEEVEQWRGLRRDRRCCREVASDVRRSEVDHCGVGDVRRKTNRTSWRSSLQESLERRRCRIPNRLD